MKKLKLFLTFALLIFCISPAFAVGDICIDKDNGVYHIILKGEKIKKKIKLQN